MENYNKHEKKIKMADSKRRPKKTSSNWRENWRRHCFVLRN